MVFIVLMLLSNCTFDVSIGALFRHWTVERTINLAEIIIYLP